MLKTRLPGTIGGAAVGRNVREGALAKKVIILVGTTKGAFLVESGAKRTSWKLKGPLCDGWPLNHVVGDPESGAIYAGGGNEWFGHDVWKSTDRGETWTRSGKGLTYAKSAAEPVKAVWSLHPRNGSLYAGVKPAGLFRSDDGGESWRHIGGLQKHPTRPEWHGGGAGLILHSIVADPKDEDQVWIGMSAVGVFHSGDGGKSWQPRNKGTRTEFMPGEPPQYPEFGQCVHCLVQAAGGRRLYQQNHCGMYRSDDGGETWESIEAGLPSSFGFAAAAHPRDPETLFLLPLNNQMNRFPPDGKAAVYRTRDGGESWKALRKGLPQENAFFAVLRQAMATDRLEPAGVYFGTNSGSLFASADEGETWSQIAQHLPTVLSVETLVVN